MWHRTQFLVFTTMVSHSASLHTKRFPSNDIAVHKHRFMCYKIGYSHPTTGPEQEIQRKMERRKDFI
jgi:hypothetical protein